MKDTKCSFCGVGKPTRKVVIANEKGDKFVCDHCIKTFKGVIAALPPQCRVVTYQPTEDPEPILA